MSVSAPVRLDETHQLDQFACGIQSLDDWLKRRAGGNGASGASQTYVACVDSQVVAYYALCAGSVHVAAAPGRFRRNMPDPVPVVVLGRLAVNVTCKGQGIGRALFRDAGLRVLNAADIIGVRGLLVDAISDEAKAFYLALGMIVSPLAPMTLMVTLDDLRASIGD